MSMFARGTTPSELVVLYTLKLNLFKSQLLETVNIYIALRLDLVYYMI